VGFYRVNKSRTGFGISNLFALIKYLYSKIGNSYVIKKLFNNFYSPISASLFTKIEFSFPLFYKSNSWYFAIPVSFSVFLGQGRVEMPAVKIFLPLWAFSNGFPNVAANQIINNKL
jgi:hypothetical protein